MKTDLQIIYESCCNTTGYNISSKSRAKLLSYSRMIYFHFAREKTNESLTSIGKLANRDHATALYGIKKYKEYIKYADFKNLSKAVEEKLPSIEVLGLTIEEREIKMLYSKNKRLEKQVEYLKNKIKSNDCEFLEELKELPEDQRNEFRDVRWMPYKRMLESRVKYKN
jgi:hypothetical protein